MRDDAPFYDTVRHDGHRTLVLRLRRGAGAGIPAL